MSKNKMSHCPITGGTSQGTERSGRDERLHAWVHGRGVLAMESLAAAHEKHAALLSPHITRERHVCAALRAAPCVCIHLATVAAPISRSTLHCAHRDAPHRGERRDHARLAFPRSIQSPTPLLRRFDLALAHSYHGHTRPWPAPLPRLVVTTH
jgi:hypothetical protein